MMIFPNVRLLTAVYTYLSGLISVAIRTADITADLLSESTIKEFILAKVQGVADSAVRASGGRRVATRLSPSRSPLSVDGGLEKSTMMKVLRDLRRWGSKDAGLGTVRTARVVFPSTEMVMKKSTTPYPLVSLQALGTNSTIPMSDDTLCHIAAVSLAKIIPIY